MFNDLYPLQLKEESEDDSDGDSHESYEDIETTRLSYKEKMLMESEDLPDGYVHLVKNERKEEGETKETMRRQNEYGESS